MRRDELLDTHSVSPRRRGPWCHVLLIVSVDFGADEAMTEEWLVKTSMLPAKTVRDAVTFFRTHGLVVAEPLPGASWQLQE